MSESYQIEYRPVESMPYGIPQGISYWQAHSEGGLSLSQAKDYAKNLSDVYVHVRIVKTTIEREVVPWQE